MFITAANAQSIATEMKCLLGYDINIMDETATIIASTNPARIGNFHEGAKKIIELDMDSLVIETDKDYPGCIPGVNFPIKISGKTVGAIGVTNMPPDDVTSGSVIKRMTELMVESLRQKDDQLLINAARGQFVASWIVSDGCDIDDLAARGQLLGIDISIPRTVIVIELGASEGSEEDFTGMSEIKTNILLGKISDAIAADRNSLCHIFNRRIVMLVPNKSKSELAELIHIVNSTIASFCSAEIFVGISSKKGANDTVGVCYREAKSACEIAKAPGGKRVVYYNGADPEFIASSIPQDIRSAIIRSVFGECSNAEREQFVSALEYYFRYAGNMNDAAEAMFIHRNTLQYRLNKLAEKTGYNYKNPSDAFILYLVAVWLRS